MQFILTSNQTAQCATATTPIVFGSQLTVAAGTGATAIAVTTVASGSPAYKGGIVGNPGCKPIRLDLTYVTGGTCSTCDTEALTTTPISVVVPAGSTMTIPDGFWSALSIVSLDGTATTATNVLVDQTVFINSQYVPACESCTVLVP